MSRSSTEHHLELYLIGPPEVRLNGKSFTSFPTQKAQALLFYLATSQRSHAREKLAAIFWPRTPLERGRKNLRDTLFQLNQHFRPFLQSTPQLIEFDGNSNFTLDVQVFRQAFGKSHDGIPGERRSIANLYRDDFLFGFSLQDAPAFDEWASVERENLHQLAVDGLVKLIPHALNHDPYQDGIALCNQLQRMEPWNAEAMLAKLKLLHHSGQRAAAAQEYRTYYQLLENEFGIEPSQPLQDLYEQMTSGTSLSELNGAKHVRIFHQIEEPSAPSARVAIPRNLDTNLGSFIGREREIEQTFAQLYTLGTRLLTIVGAGGMGKTKLAQQMAYLILDRENRPEKNDGQTLFQDGIYFIPLSPIHIPFNASRRHAKASAYARGSATQNVVLAIAQTLQLRMFGPAPALEQLIAYIRTKRLLLILDNFEHLLSSVSLVSILLDEAPNVRIIVTSRQRLNLAEEKLLKLQGLLWKTKKCQPCVAAPPSKKIAVNNTKVSDAVRLFQARTQLADKQPPIKTSLTPILSTPNSPSNFAHYDNKCTKNIDSAEAIQQICSFVEGMPLAIELAAALSHTIPLNDIAQALREDYDILQTDLHGFNQEHKSIRVMFDASWRILTSLEKQTLARLSLFNSGFTKEAAVSVAGASEEILRELVHKSFIHELPISYLSLNRDISAKNISFSDAEAHVLHYEMHALIHRYARDQLALKPADEAATQERYITYFVTLLREHNLTWLQNFSYSEQERLKGEGSNLAAAWEMLHKSNNIAQIVQYVDDLWLFYKSTTQLAMALKTVNEGLAAVPQSSAPHINRWLWYLCETYFELGQLTKSNEYGWMALKEMGYAEPKNMIGRTVALLFEAGKQSLYRLGKPSKNQRALALQKLEQPKNNLKNEEQIIAARVYSRLQYNSYINNASGDLIYYGLRFVNLAEDSQDYSALGSAYAQMALLCGMLRFEDQAGRYISLSDQCTAFVEQRSITGQPHTLSVQLQDEAKSALCIGLYYISTGQWSEAEQRLKFAYTANEKVENWVGVGDCITLLNSIALKKGDFHQGMSYGLILENVAQTTQNASHIAWSLMVQSASLIYMGQALDALPLLEKALPLSEKSLMRDIGYLTGYSAKGLGHLQLGEYRLARNAADMSFASLTKFVPTSIIHLYCFDCLLLVYTALWELAHKEHNKMPSSYKLATCREYKKITSKLIRRLVRLHWHHSTVRPYIHLYRGRYLWLTGKMNHAIAEWQMGLQFAKSQEQPPLIGRLHYEIGRHTPITSASGKEHLQEAEHIFSSCDMLHDLALVHSAQERTST